ncbi:MAG TPA: sensor histidine kinase [Thermomicrobiaceae bacterium]|nr:sensor histidine kinase [Thermomicrobiaceae bacterium]
MSGSLPDVFSHVKQIIDDGIEYTAVRLADSADELRTLLAELESERSQVQNTLEERALDHLIAGDHSRARGHGTGELHRREDHLAQEYTEVSTLYRQITDFASFLTASRQQFRVEGQLLGVDEAQRLGIRQAMIRAQEDERRRLAREIHDGPAQVLANAIIGLEFIERSLRQTAPAGAERAVGEIERVKTAMREGLTELRRFIFDLRPTMLNQRGLVGTVEHYVETYRSFFSSEVELKVPPSVPRLTPEQELTAFRVIQESLQNVHRHARASRVAVSITSRTDVLIVRVRDDGDGFRAASVHPTASGGLGLAGMRERAEVIGGKLRVRSAPGKGTEVTLEIPLVSATIDARSHGASGAAVPN